jgi:predicted porin
VFSRLRLPNTGNEILASQHFGDYEMRKTQIALAAVALVASSAALAQVSVYGNADGSIISSGGSTVLDGGGGYTTSLIGFRGSEDLGGGLKASFNLETGANLGAGQIGDAGGGNRNIFNRAANVSLGTESVGVTFGNQFSIAVADALVGATAGAGDNVNVAAVQRLILKPGSTAFVSGPDGSGAGAAFFIPDAVTLRVSGGGLTFKAMTRVQPTSAANSGYTAFTLGGGFEGVNFAVGQQTSTNATGGTGLDYKATFVAVNTTVAGIGLNGAWANNTGGVAAAVGKTFMIGASYPITEALSVGAIYAKGNATTGNQTSVNVKYSLSKSTVAYVTTSNFSISGAGAYANTGALGATAAGKNVTSVGISYSF